MATQSSTKVKVANVVIGQMYTLIVTKGSTIVGTSMRLKTKGDHIPSGRFIEPFSGTYDASNASRVSEPFIILATPEQLDIDMRLKVLLTDGLIGSIYIVNSDRFAPVGDMLA